MVRCPCGGQDFRPVAGEWICARCGEPNGFVRPYFQLYVEHDRWFGVESPRESSAVAYRKARLREARQWAEARQGKVVICVRRRPELRPATILGY